MAAVRLGNEGVVLCLAPGEEMTPELLAYEKEMNMTPEMIAQESADHKRALKRAFLAFYENSGNMREGCKQISTGLATVERWLQEDPEFKENFSRAQRLAGNMLEAEMKRRAVDGCRKYKFDKGNPVYWHPTPGHPDYELWIPPKDHPDYQGEGVKVVKFVHYYELVYSDQLLMAMAKAAMPEKYGDKEDKSASVVVKMYGFDPSEIGTRSLKELPASGECEIADAIDRS